jgi:hypothetical protein
MTETLKKFSKKNMRKRVKKTNKKKYGKYKKHIGGATRFAKVVSNVMPRLRQEKVNLQASLDVGKKLLTKTYESTGSVPLTMLNAGRAVSATVRGVVSGPGTSRMRTSAAVVTPYALSYAADASGVKQKFGNKISSATTYGSNMARNAIAKFQNLKRLQPSKTHNTLMTVHSP